MWFIMENVLDIATIYPNKMLIHYLSGRSPMLEFFGSQLQSFHSIKFLGDRSILKEVLLKYNKAIGAQNEVLENIELVENEDIMFVVTGQQPGFLTGPLYTIYKSLSAINYAERYSDSKINLIPLFWNASEDHDVEEVNNIWILNKRNDIEPVRIEDESMVGKSLEAIQLDKKKIERILDEMLESLPNTDFTELVFKELVYEELRKSKRWGEFFSRILTRLMGQWGLIIIEPRVLRPYLKDFFIDLISDPLYYNRVFLSTTNKLKEMGYAPKLHKKENIAGLFYIDENCFRNRIVINENNEYELSNGLIFTKEEIINEIEAHPERFSTNAIFRPIAQDMMLPTYIYVAGPSELGYHIQIKDLYKEFRMTQPNLLFRMGATLVERHIDKIIQKYDFKILELLNLNKLITRILKSKNKDFLDKYFEQILSILDDLKERLASINKELGIRTEYKKQSIKKILTSIEEMFIEYIKRDSTIMISQLEKAKAYLFPSEKPQERVFNIFQYLNKYSLSLLGCVKEVLREHKPGSHVVIKCWMF